MSSSKKRQQTMAKRAREQAVKERRARKLAKKQAAVDARRNQNGDPAALPKQRGDERTFGPLA